MSDEEMALEYVVTHPVTDDFPHWRKDDYLAGFRAGREEAAKICDTEAALRRFNSDKAMLGDTSFGMDTQLSAIIQGNKGVTAACLAAAIRGGGG